MEVITFCRFGYVLILGTFFLMIWISMSHARETEVRYPPCYFNPLCSCSKGIPDLGIVTCQDVHLPRIPETVNVSKVFMLHLDNNNLRTLEPYFLQSTGLYKIMITRNPLAFIPDEAFLGLERSLWELNLSYNQLTKVPNRAIRYLQKLRLLDLTGNDIVTVTAENWRGIESSLRTIVLADNSITHLTTDLFSGLPLLETIDLKGNNLKEIDPSVFRDGMESLTTVILADNQLSAIPYQALSYLRSLKTLDLSYNKINNMEPAAEVGIQNVNYNYQFNLDLLRLDYNQITQLEPIAFEYFNILNRTFLDGNPINTIEDNAFRQAKIKELYLRNCDLEKVSPVAFAGLEGSLEVIDLSGNRITSLPDQIFYRLDMLKTLSLKDNVLSKIDPLQAFNGFQFSLIKLDISGDGNAPVSMQALRRLRNLRVLSLSRLSQSSLSPDDFLEFGVDVDELMITFGRLQTIKNNAFRHVHGVKKLQLSDNVISNIEPEAFIDIGHSLTTLKLSHALSSSIQNLPSEAIKTLFNLEELDLSNNRIKFMSDTSFHFLKKLKKLNLQDNVIELINKGTFQGDIHRDLTDIFISFNNLRLIQQHTFADLAQLEQIALDDNKIESLQRRSFMNLDRLKKINLKGNKISSISFESFQNLPELEELDLSYNSINGLDFGIFDQVGTLAMLSVNISHNKIMNLVVTPSMDYEMEIGVGGVHAHIKILDLSYNNISSISKQFFRPTELSLGHLDLSHNKILNATKDVFGNMPHLQILDLSYNVLYDLDFDTFRNTKNLQILLASNNRIAEIPNDLFKFSSNLRMVDFSYNRLRSLPDNLFRENGLEHLDLSHNLLGKMPLTALSVASAQSLCELDLSWNSISSLTHGSLLAKFKSLSFLDLSFNRLGQIDAGTFKGMSRLSTLNLGHNSQLNLETSGLSFQGLEYPLLHLNLDNVSISQIPSLTTPNLITLSLAHNFLPTIPSDIAGNASLLRYINLDYNDLSSIPIVTHSLTELRHLSLAGNPITTITNTSLLGVANQLQELDLRHVDLDVLESGAFCKMQSLRVLRLELFSKVKNLNIPRMLQFCSGVKTLEIHVEKEKENLDDELMGEWPSKLQNITLIGRGVKKLSAKTFQGVLSPVLHLTLRNTSVAKISTDLFKNMFWVRNISVDVRYNTLLKNLQNPSTGVRLGHPRATFLTDLKLTGNKWTCDCELGWVEVWQRKQRQYFCDFDNCKPLDDDLRTTLCSNKKNQSLIEVLKTEIECGWSAASLPPVVLGFVILMQVFVRIVI